MHHVACLKRVHSCFADANEMDVWLIRTLMLPFSPMPGVTLIVDDWIATPFEVAYRTVRRPENTDDSEIKKEVERVQKEAAETGRPIDAARLTSWLKGPSSLSWFEIYVEPNQEIFDAQANRKTARPLDEVVADECETGWTVLCIGAVPEHVTRAIRQMECG